MLTNLHDQNNSSYLLIRLILRGSLNDFFLTPLPIYNWTKQINCKLSTKLHFNWICAEIILFEISQSQQYAIYLFSLHPIISRKIHLQKQPTVELVHHKHTDPLWMYNGSVETIFIHPTNYFSTRTSIRLCSHLIIAFHRKELPIYTSNKRLLCLPLYREMGKCLPYKTHS